MLKNRVIIISLVIICLAAAIYYLSNIRDTKDQSSRFCSFINPEDVKQITIAKEGQTLKLTPRDNRWFVTDNNSIEIAVDSSRILPVFEFVNDSLIIQRITKKESSYSNFDLTGPKAAKLIIQGKKSGDQVFHIGKQKDHSSQFVRKETDPYVYLVSKRLNIDMDMDRWFYKKVLDYDLTGLDYIEYTCNNDRKIKVFYDKAGEKFFVKEVPEGMQTKGLANLKKDFLKISVSKYLPRSQKVDTTPVCNHTLYFKTGESVRLDFLKSTEEKSSKHYLDIKFEAKESRDKGLKYIRSVSGRYLFVLSQFDKKKYQRDYDDFFEKKPEEAPEKKLNKDE